MQNPAKWHSLVSSLPLEGIIDLVFPPYCALCGEMGGWLCDACAEEVLQLGASQRSGGQSTARLSRLECVAPHIGASRRLVHQLKYGGMRVLAAPMAALMYAAHADLLATVEVLVPVPLHPKRVRRRGYNQAVLLAEALGQCAGCAVESDLVVRVRDTPSQVGLTRAERRANVAGAFAVRSEIVGHVLLVDDVYTTGATLNACAQAVTQAGAARVSGLVFARAVDGDIQHPAHRV